MNIQKMIGSMAGLIVMAAAIVPAHAQTPVGAPNPVFVTVSGFGTISGSQVAPTITSVLASVGGGPSGTLTSQVFQGFAGNPLGGLTFVYTISEATAGTGAGFSSLGASGFTGFSTDVAYVTANTTSGLVTNGNSITALRTGTAVNSGNLVNFGFGPLVATGDQVQLVVFTNSNNVSFQVDNVQNGGAHMVTAYGAAAPEPASFAVFGFVGLGVLGLMVRARRGKTQLAV